MAKKNGFYVKDIKRDTITLKEDKNYKSPVILFLITNGRLIFIIAMMLSLSLLLISTSLVFKNMKVSLFSDEMINSITGNMGSIIVNIDGSNSFKLDNVVPITEEYATKLYDSTLFFDSSLMGVVIKVNEISLDDKTLVFYSDKTSLIKYKDGTYLKVFRVNNGYGLLEDGTINSKAETEKLSAREEVNKELNIRVLYFSDGSAEVMKDKTSIYVRNSDITMDNKVFYTNLSLVSLPILIEDNRVYYSNDIVKENDYLLIGDEKVMVSKTIELFDDISIIYYDNGYAEVIKGNYRIMVEKSSHIVYDDNILEIVSNVNNNEEVNIDNFIGIKNIEIMNNNDKDIRYMILLEESSNYNKYNINKRLSNEYVKYLVSVNDSKLDIEVLDNNIKGSSKSNGLKLVNNAYLLYEGNLDKSSVDNIKLGIWVDYQTITNEYMDAGFIGTIKVYIE